MLARNMSSGDRSHLIDTLFNDPCRMRTFEPGEEVMHQGQRNTRLYYVHSGRLQGVREVSGAPDIPVLRFRPGELVGINGIFINDQVSTLTVRVEAPSMLAWIDLAEDRPEHFEERIIPILVRALLKRQELSLQAAERKRSEELRDKELEQMGFLGQMAAAVAHELNNALAVVARGGEWLGDAVENLVDGRPQLEADAFRCGWRDGRVPKDQEDIRIRSAILRKQGADFASARRIAQIDPKGAIFPSIARYDEGEINSAINAWELGATLRDMAVSSRQAAHVVTALKQLGASDRLRKEMTIIDESIHAALTILGRKLDGVELKYNLRCTEPFAANQGELVQIWSNLMGNACEAMKSKSSGRPSSTSKANLNTTSPLSASKIMALASIPSCAVGFFEPNVTTKKEGLSFGLGLGLAVVKRLVTLYQGTIFVESNTEGTTFVVRLPCSTPQRKRTTMICSTHITSACNQSSGAFI